MRTWRPPTSEPAVGPLLVSIHQAIATVTGPDLVGLYLFGSLATGDYEAGVSDLDLLAVLSDPPGRRLVQDLDRMRADLVRANPAWDERIEVVYISRRDLASCRTGTATVAVASSGEPFQVVEAGPGWVLTWYPARESGVRLAGPPLGSLIPPIPKTEFVAEVRRSLARLATRIPDDAPPGWQAYAILTTCRGLRTIRVGDGLSKREAAAWAQRAYPHRADLIRRALGWRQRQWDPGGQDGAATVAATRSFLAELSALAQRTGAWRRGPGSPVRGP
jgi:hypothetical protein